MIKVIKTIIKVFIGIPVLLLCIMIEPVVGDEIPRKMRRKVGIKW